MLGKIMNTIKETYAGIFISLAICFMLLFYEPLLLFSNNLTDFWFDIYMFFPIILFQFIICFLFCSFIFIVFKKINNKLYIISVVISLILLLYFYIQGNYLSLSLPAIDGSAVDFSNFTAEKIISFIVLLVIACVISFVFYKFKFKSIEKVAKYSSLIIIVMLFSSLVPSLTKKEFFDRKRPVVATVKNFNNMSSDKNFIIFLIDATDSKAFNNEVTRLNKVDSLFTNFTYYPDTLAGYPFTRNSIPFIFSGKWYENEIDFKEYMTDSFDNSEFIKKLESLNYNMNLYEYDLNSYVSDNYKKYDNLEILSNINLVSLFKQEAKLLLYKYLPYQLKNFSKIDTFNMNDTKKNDKLYIGENVNIYERIKSESINVTDKNNFHFIHIEGAHVPLKYDIDLNVVENGTYEGNIDSCITILETYLNKLKETNVYDNSVIVIMSDHGYGDSLYDRTNPILYIKGFNEKHDYRVSDKKISFVDLSKAFNELLDLKETDEIFADLDNSERRYLLYEYTNPDKLIEYIQYGQADNLDSMKKTGEEFIRR